MGTGHHAALAAGVGLGKTVAVVGDGAVGLCGVIAAKRLGAERIILLGSYPDRIALAKEFGATDVVSERGDEAVARARWLPRDERPREDQSPDRVVKRRRAWGPTANNESTLQDAGTNAGDRSKEAY